MFISLPTHVSFSACLLNHITYFRYNQPDMKMSDAAKFMVSLSVDVQDGRDRLVVLK